MIIGKKQSNTCDKIEKQEEKMIWVKGCRNGGFSWEMEQRPWDRWRGALGEFSPYYENTTKHETPAVNDSKLTGSSHQEAAACQQTPTNEWKSLN